MREFLGVLTVVVVCALALLSAYAAWQDDMAASTAIVSLSILTLVAVILWWC